jgi:hypothetical protein
MALLSGFAIWRSFRTASISEARRADGMTLRAKPFLMQAAKS